MKEFGKSLLLIALTISALFLTNAVFVKDSFEEAHSETEYVIEDFLELVRPQNYSVNFGDSFIKIYSDEYERVAIREEYNKIFRNFIIASSDITVEEISMSNWQEKTKRKSIRVDYPFSISLENLLKVYNIEPDMKEASNGIKISSVLLLTNRSDTIYIYDGSNGKYYRIPGENIDIWIDSIYGELAYSKKQNEYRMLENRFKLLDGPLKEYNLEQPNLLLTPISIKKEYPKYMLAKEFDVNENSSNIEKQAKIIFDDDMSFVKKSVYIDNSTTYIYGYGEKVFKVNADGSIEYLVKADVNTPVEPIDFIAGLSQSMDQIEKMGVSSDTIYLSNYSQIETSNGFETSYSFNYKRDGIPFYSIQSGDGGLIEVKFSNTDLVKAKKYARIRMPEINELSFNQVDFKSIFTIDSNRFTFEKNYEEDYEELRVDKSDIFFMYLHEMKSLDINYYIDITVKPEELVPVWNMVIANTRYFIEMYSGKIIRLEKVNEE